MDTKKLRQKILDLAIHGKLVPQDPNDEPASVLLERIRKEKERLVKEGKIKKSKSSASSDKPPYENVPEGWRACKLHEITFIGTGSTPNKINKQYWDGEIAWVSSSATNKPFIDEATTYITEKALHDTNCQEYPIGTIIMAMYGEGKTRGQISELRIKSCTNQACAAIIPIIKDTKEYIKLYLQSQYYHLRELAEGGLQPNLNLTKISEYVILLPSLAEQKRIVNCTKKYLEFAESIETYETDLSNLIQNSKDAILKLAIHGKLVPQNPNDEPASAMLKKLGITSDNRPYENVPFEIPGSWSWTCMDELNKYKSISVDPGKEPNADYELYSVPNFETGMPEFVKGKDVSSAKKSVVKNDVLLCKINPHLNRAWVVPHIKKDLRCIASSEWIVFRNEETNPEYMKMCFTSPYFKELMLSNVSGVGGSLMRAQPASVGKYLFPLPPLDEQIRIVSKVNELILQLENIEQSLQE